MIGNATLAIDIDTVNMHTVKRKAAPSSGNAVPECEMPKGAGWPESAS
jgi:hypothetical protein